ncbi:MAG: helix-turn-helix transcriptional regulator [Verrucomicrobiota bacterium]
MLITARHHVKLTQSQVAERMDTSQTAVARMERGTGNPSLSTLRKYAKALGMEIRVNFEPLKEK